MQVVSWKTCLGLLAALCVTGAACAHEFPSRPVRVILPAAAGGALDALSRIYGQKMSESWGQQVIVKHDGAWRILKRNAIYEKDRIEPVRPDVTLKLDEAELGRFPEGYRYLAYVQSESGSKVDLGLPTPRSPALEQLYREGTAWLEA